MSKSMEWHGGIAPYGFLLTDNGKLIKDKKEQKAIVIANKLRTQGHTLLDISAILANNGYLSRVHTPLSAKQIRTIVGEAKK